MAKRLDGILWIYHEDDNNIQSLHTDLQCDIPYHPSENPSTDIKT
jgi:hypothetical protein